MDRTVIENSAPSVTDVHPLRPLAAEEIELAAALVRGDARFEPSTRFVYVSLVEPPKTEVLASTGDQRPSRLVKLVLRSPSRRATYEVVVSLDEKALVSWAHLPGAQPSLTRAGAGSRT